MKILPFVTQSHPALPNLKNIQMGKWHLKTNPYYHIANESRLHNSYAFRSEDLKAPANGRSRTSPSIPLNDRLSFAFRFTRRVAAYIEELFIGQVTSFIALIQLFFI